jgi:hypothetical protein
MLTPPHMVKFPLLKNVILAIPLLFSFVAIAFKSPSGVIISARHAGQRDCFPRRSFSKLDVTEGRYVRELGGYERLMARKSPGTSKVGIFIDSVSMDRRIYNPC